MKALVAMLVVMVLLYLVGRLHESRLHERQTRFEAAARGGVSARMTTRQNRMTCSSDFAVDRLPGDCFAT